MSSSARSSSALLAAIVSIVLVAVATAPVPPPAAGPLRGAAAASTLHVGFLQAIDSLNPFRGVNDPSFMLYGMVYDYLFSLDQDGNFVPNLAVAASCDATCRNWTYQIRQGVLWSDGTHFTADDVAFTINYDIQNFAQLWGYELYVNRIVQCSSATKPNCGAVVTSPWNVTVYFDRPFVAGKAVFVPILQKAQWQGISAQQAQLQFNNPTPIGTGPFIADPNIYTEWTTSQPLHLLRNPSYHPVGNHVGPAVLTDLFLQQFADENTLVAALSVGVIDLGRLTAAGYAALQGHPNIGLQAALLSTQYWNMIGFSQLDASTPDNKLNPARWDINVRTALAMATNKDYIVNTIYQGKGVRGSSLMSPVTPQWHYDPIADATNLTFDIRAANDLLNRSGYTTWTGGSFGNGVRKASADIAFRVETNAFPGGTTKIVPAGTPLNFTMAVRQEFPQEWQTAAYLQAQWAQVGVHINLKIELEPALAADVYGGNVETYIWFWSGDPDPNYLLSIESGYTLDGWNDNYWDNSTFNGLYVQQLAALNATARAGIVRAAEKVHYLSAVYLIYVYPYGEWAYRTDHFVNWGDWTAHPYRQMDSFWGANPLFLELAPAVSNIPPSTPTITGPASLKVNQVGSFTGSSVDPDPNETLTWNWTWGDGTFTIVRTTSATTSVVANHAWTAPGFYSVSLTVSDGSLSAASAPFSTEVFGVSISGGVARPGSPLTLAVLILEPSKGKWSVGFGDGSAAAGTFPAGETSFGLTHTYVAAGTYTVTLVAKMGSRTDTATSTVYIDATPPVLQLPANVTAEATGVLTPVSFVVSATDNVGLAAPPTCSPASGSLFPLGTSTVTCQATDLAGNTATGSFVVTVRDTTPPAIQVPANITFEANSSTGSHVNFVVTATDAVGVASGPTCAPASGSLFPIGSTVVQCTATDTSGNVGTGSFLVLVRDTTPPVTTIVSIVDGSGFPVGFNGSTPSPSITFGFTGTDAVGVVGFVCSLDGAPFSPCSTGTTYGGLAAGFHIFAVAAVDAAGNRNPVSFLWSVMTPLGTVQDLVAKVNALQASGVLTAKQADALLASLSKATSDLSAGRVGSAIKDLQAFNATVAQYIAAGILPPSTGQGLENEACDLIIALGGTC